MNSSLPESSILATDSNDSQRSTPVLDVNVLRERCLGNLSLVAQILSRVESALQHETTQLQDAWTQRDFSVIAAVAHRLKGTSANVGAEALCRAADELESVALTEHEGETAQSLQQLERQIRRLSNAVIEHPVD